MIFRKDVIAINHLSHMKCLDCKSDHVNKNGKKRGRQNYICVDCQRQFFDHYQEYKGYSEF